MKYVILYIELPISDRFLLDQSDYWKAIEKCVEPFCQQTKDCKRLGKSCWLLPLNSSLATIGEAVYFAQKANFPYQTLYFDKAEDWVRYEK